MIDARTLLRIIRELDVGLVADSNSDFPYLDITRWNGDGRGEGETDEEATAAVRQLVREELGRFTLEEIAAATLADIDTRSAA